MSIKGQTEIHLTKKGIKFERPNHTLWVHF
nr:MAG TPA: hypothetical protein [Caudoviricetes sp.]